MRKAWLGMLVVLLPLLGCGDADAEMDFGNEDLGSDRYAITSADGGAKMGLTDDYVYFALADSVLAAARAEMRETAESDGAKGFVGGLVERTVGKAMGFRARIPVEDIEDIRWEDGRMRIVFTDPDRRFGNTFRVDDAPAEEAFREEDVRAMAEEFRRLKDRRTDG